MRYHVKSRLVALEDPLMAELSSLVTDLAKLMADLPISKELPALDNFELAPKSADWVQLVPVPLPAKKVF